MFFNPFTLSLDPRVPKIYIFILVSGSPYRFFYQIKKYLLSLISSPGASLIHIQRMKEVEEDAIEQKSAKLLLLMEACRRPDGVLLETHRSPWKTNVSLIADRYLIFI